MQTVETVAQVEGVDTSELLGRVSKEADAYRASRATSPDAVSYTHLSRSARSLSVLRTTRV